MTNQNHYDAVIIGTGQGGGPLASALAGAGRRTAIIERSHVGGSCINYGCTPTKTMVASARVAHLARRAADYGVVLNDVAVDLKQVRERKRSMVKSFRSGSEKSLTGTENLDLIRGEGSFSGSKTIKVAKDDGSAMELSADQIFINTGQRPRIPDIEGLGGIDFLDSTSIMELAEVPEHLLIIGGGYIGIEFGQMFRRFGAQVTIIQRAGQLLPREDEDIAEAVTEILREDGIEVFLGSSAAKTAQENGRIRVVVQTPDGERRLEGSHLLLAAGRVPNTDALNLESAAIKFDNRGNIRVNDRLETSAEGVFALGDVKGGPAFTHISYDDYRILKTNILEGGNSSTSDRIVPYTVFMDPELGRVGMTEKDARKNGIDYRIAKMPMKSAARALETDETRGLWKALVGPDDQILGAAMLSIEGGEIATIIQTAMMGKLPYTVLRDGVFSHPTLAESLNNLFTSLE